MINEFITPLLELLGLGLVPLLLIILIILFIIRG